MITINRIFDLKEVNSINRINGISMVFVKAVFFGLNSETQTTFEAEVGLVVYEDSPIVVVDSNEYKLSDRAKRVATTQIKKFLEGWDGVEFDRKAGTSNKVRSRV